MATKSRMDQKLTFRNTLANYLGRVPFVNMAARRVLRSGSSVFMFHRVLPQGEDCYEPEMATSKEAFAAILDWLTENFQVLPLDELVQRRGKSFDKKPA